jgi:hypothetical protein
MSDVLNGVCALDVVKSTFDFNIGKYPLSGPDNMRTPWYGLFREDTTAVVGNGSVSNVYVPHQTDDVLALVESAITAFDSEMEVNCGFKNGHYVNLAPTKAERRAIYGTADNIFPRIMIRAGYDGKAFQASLGFYRDACMNMTMLRSVKSCHVSIRHTSGLRGKMDELIAQFATLRHSWGSLAATVEHMQSSDVRLSEYLNQVYGDAPERQSITQPGRALSIHTNRTEAIVRRVMREATATGRPHRNGIVSVWEAFNAVQGYVQHDATRKGNPNSLERTILAGNDSAVKQAETIAMASLSV